MKIRSVVILVVCCFAFCFQSAISQAVIFPFELVGAGDYDLDITVDVSGNGDNAEFTFYNDSLDNCSVARIYFDDSILSGIYSVTNGPGTNFASVFPGPGNLPGGQNIDFYADKEFSIGAGGPPPEYGINNAPEGEWVTVAFNLDNGGTFADVLDELYDGRLQIGLHIIAFDDGSSQTAVSVPEPSTVCVLGLGTLVQVLRRKKRRRYFH